MAYNFPAHGGLRYTQNGKTAGVFFVSTVLGPQLVVGELTESGWLSRWNHGPKQQVDWEKEIAEAGGKMELLKTLLAAISTALKQIWGSEAPVPKNFVEEMNALLAEKFQLSGVGITIKV